MARSLDGDLDLGAYAVGGGDEDGIGKTGGLEIEQAAEAADLGVRTGARGPAQQRLDQFHHAIAGVDIDTGGRVARLVHGATKRDRLSFLPGGRNCPAPPTAESPGAQARAPLYNRCSEGARPEDRSANRINLRGSRRRARSRGAV